jgi:hypothetical protein
VAFGQIVGERDGYQGGEPGEERVLDVPLRIVPTEGRVSALVTLPLKLILPQVR